MFVPFVYELRKRKIPVGTQEALSLAKALRLGLHDSSLGGFYHVARALLVHTEAHLDDFDLVFGAYFRGVTLDAQTVTEEILAWLKDVRKARELTDEEKALIEALDPETLQREFADRLKNQKERHDGGSRWIGTGGTSPFGRGGYHPSGISVGGGGGRSAVRSADARKFKGYRSDVALDVRQVQVALRKLRAFVREGAETELDLEATIDETAKNAGELEVVLRPVRRHDTRVLLLMDVGGSMDPFAETVSQLFSAAKKSTHWKDLQTYYFHNCVYGRVYQTEGFRDPVTVSELMRRCDGRYKLVIVGDALMAPYELMASGGMDDVPTAGIHWLMQLREHHPRSVWLNPERAETWRGNTIEVIRGVFPMFQLTLEGLGEAVGELTRKR